MKIVNSLKSYSVWGNSVYDYLLFLLIFLGALIVLKLFERYAAAKLKKWSDKTENEIDNVLVDVVGDINFLFYFVTAFFISFQWLDSTSIINRVVNIIFVVILSREAINGIGRLLKFAGSKYLAQLREEDSADADHASTIMSMSRKAVIIVLWLVLGTFILSNFGVNITSLVTGLGIGGIAIGFALQNILGDIFSSVSIFLDKPFKVGDFIQVGEDQGTVEKIGIKSTRIETLRGEELVISNKELTSSRIQNYSRTERIRDQITIGVSYETSKQTLKKIPEMIRAIIEDIDEVDFDRCRLNSYGDSPINFKVVYYVNSISFAGLDEKKEELNYAIFDKFEQEGIEFPFPTRTVHLHQENEA